MPKETPIENSLDSCSGRCTPTVACAEFEVPIAAGSSTCKHLNGGISADLCNVSFDPTHMLRVQVCSQRELRPEP
jgi:hypothetical protein